MEDLIAQKNAAIKLMDQKDYQNAIFKFNKVIKELPNPENDDQVVLKAACLLDSSSCYTKLKSGEDNFKQSLELAQAALSLTLKSRPAQWKVGKTSSEIAKDPVIVLIALSYIQLGKLDDVQNNFLDALLKFRSASLYNHDKASDAIFDLLEDLGVVTFDENDSDLEIFSRYLKIIRDLSNAAAAESEIDPSQISDASESSLTAEVSKIEKATDDLILLFKDTELPKPLIEKINKSLCFHTLFAAMRIYTQSHDFLLKSYELCTYALKQGVTSIWDGLIVIAETLAVDVVDVAIAEAALILFKLAPKGIFKPITVKHLLLPILTVMLFPDLSEEGFSTVCYLGFMTLDEDPNEVVEVSNPLFVEKCLERRNVDSLKLLSKLVFYSPHAALASDQDTISYLSDVLENKTEPDYIIPAIIIAVKIFLLTEKWPLKSDENSEEFKKLSVIANRYVNAILPVISSRKDFPPIISYGFASISLIVRYAREAIVDKKAYLVASVMLSKYKTSGDKSVSGNIVTFLYECAQNNLINELKKLPIIVETVLKIIQANSKSQQIVERGVGFLLLMEHPIAIQLLQAGLLTFPTSEFLRNLYSKYNPNK